MSLVLILLSVSKNPNLFTLIRSAHHHYMVVSEPIIVLELDVVLAETIGDFNIMTTLTLQQSKEE